MKYLAILASGAGTNAENIIRYFKENQDIRVKVVLTNRSKAGVLERARALGCECAYFSSGYWKDGKAILAFLKAQDISFVVLAGFLAYVPDCMLKAYEHRMVNIHPSLIPKFSGKGMYGDRVHEAVLESGEKQSGITIHFTSPELDAGEIIFQTACPVKDTDNVLSLASRIHSLEYEHYPRVIERLVRNQD